MAQMDDVALDALLRAGPLPEPPESVTRRAALLLRRSSVTADARRTWLDRLADVTAQFEALLAAPETPLLAVATRGETAEATVSGSVDAALGCTVVDRSIHGQVFVSPLELPEGLEVELRRGDEVLEVELTDPAGRFVFAELPPGAYRLQVAQLGLIQDVTLAA